MTFLLLLACKPSVIDMGDTAATGDSGVAGPGSGRAGDIQVTPESVAFGEVGVGCGADETVEIANVGDAELEVSSVELTGDASLVLSADAFPLSLAPGESVTVDVSFSPDAEGAAEAALLVASDDPDESLVSATVAGAGTASVVEHEQSWVQTSLHPVELVMALDGSGSMYDDIATLQQSLNALLEVMRAAGTDFRVAAVADDSGCVAGDDPYIHDGHSDEEARAILATMAGVTAGSNAERAFTQLENAWTAADDGFCNDGLFSGDRQVHLFGMSDEPEQSVMDHSHYVSLFEAGFDSVRFHAVGGPPPSGCSSASYYSGMYEAVEETGGVFASICEPMEYSLSDIGQVVVEATLRDSFELDGSPDADSIVVEVDGGEVEGWTWDGSAVVFETGNVPGMSSAVRITWTEGESCG